MRILQQDLRETHNVGEDTPERIILPEVSPLMDTLNIELAGVSDAGRGFEFVRLNPHYGQVLACWAGCGEVLVGGKWIKCEPGTAYLTPPFQPHAYHTCDDQRWSFVWVAWHIPPSGTPPLCEVASPTLIPADPEYLRSAIMGLYRESIGPAQPTVLDKWVELTYDYAVRVGGQLKNRRRHNLAPLWERVDTNLAHPWTSKLLADEVGMSGETLRRICQRETGRGPMHHLTDLRMKRAAMLLESTDLKVESVAQNVGYSSAFAFSTAFKRHNGKSPAAFRIARRKARARRHAVRMPKSDPF